MNRVRFDVFTAVTVKSAVFRDMALCRCCVNRRFGGTYIASIFRVEKSTSEEPARAGGCRLQKTTFFVFMNCLERK
jgi:hypothetical protein